MNDDVRRAAEQYLRALYLKRGESWDDEADYIRELQIGKMEQWWLAHFAEVERSFVYGDESAPPPRGLLGGGAGEDA